MPTSTRDPWQALADPTRRAVYARVSRGACSVTEIAGDLPVSRPAVSQHLKVLLDARLVDVRRHGRQQLYRPRAEGLDVLRRELDGFWNAALLTFRQLAEASYEPTATEGEPR